MPVTVEVLSASMFAITDSTYGVTTHLVKCRHCGFVQSSQNFDPLQFYKDMKDLPYEANRKQRSKQAAKILSSLRPFIVGGNLLDIGAGSGILVEEGLRLGFSAEGIEPSLWLHGEALKRGLPVYLGTLPHPKVDKKYDLITIVDVLEHVNNPFELLSIAHELINDNGFIVVITPDLGSLMARILGKRWWHYRTAHIGYFNRYNLDLIMRRCGFIRISVKTAKWYFAVDYLMKRMNVYLPKWVRLPVPTLFERITLPLDLRDSIHAVYKKVGS
jgi:hypothetical protein